MQLAISVAGDSGVNRYAAQVIFQAVGRFKAARRAGGENVKIGVAANAGGDEAGMPVPAVRGGWLTARRCLTAVLRQGSAFGNREYSHAQRVRRACVLGDVKRDGGKDTLAQSECFTVNRDFIFVIDAVKAKECRSFWLAVKSSVVS